MRWLGALFAAFALVSSTVVASAQPTATTTLTVTIPARPLTTVIERDCAFQVTTGENVAVCSMTLLVADPTLSNTGWRLSLASDELTCDCGERIRPAAIVVQTAGEIALINGQPVDRLGGPWIAERSIGRALSPDQPLIVAKPSYGNGAYAVTLVLRFEYPPQTKPGAYSPTWLLGISQLDV